MRYEQTWTFQHNTIPISAGTAHEEGKSFIFQLKEFLKSVGWTVHRSCNSIVASTNDLLLSSADIVFNQEDEAHSWIILQSPEGIVAGANGTYLGNQSRIWLSISATSSGADIGTKGDLLYHREIPTITPNEITNTPSSTDALTYTFSQWIDNSGETYAPHKFHFAATDKGNFIIHTMPIESDYIFFSHGLFPFGAVDNITSTGNDYPYGVVVMGNTSTQTGVSPLTQTSMLSGESCQGWVVDGTTSYRNARILCLGNGANGWIGTSFGASGSVPDGKHISGQLHVQLETTNKAVYIGRISDVYGSGSTTVQGTANNTTPMTHQFFGNLWLPTPVSLLA